MSNLRIMWRNFFDDAVLTTDAAVAGDNVLANLQDSSRSVFRTFGQPTSVNIWGHWNGMRWPLRWFFMNRHNFPLQASIRLRTYAAADWSGSTLEDVTLAPYATATPWWGTGAQLNAGTQLLPTEFAESGIDYYAQTTALASTVGSFLLTLSASNVCFRDYWQMQRIYLGNYAEVPINPQIGANGGWQSGTTQTRLRSGSLPSDPGYLVRKFAGKMVLSNDLTNSSYFDGLNRAATVTYREELWRMLHRTELSKDVLVNVFPGYDAGNAGHLERDHTMACKLTTMPELAWQGPLRWEMPFTLEEC